MSEIFSNSILQSFLFSPLMGVIFGVLFAGLSSKPACSAPQTVVETRKVYIERTRVYRKNRSDGGEVYGFVFLLFVIAWKYMQFAPTVLYYIEVALISMMAFGIACFVVSVIKGHYVDIEWILCVAIPTVILASCLIILANAKRAITPNLIELANKSNLVDFFLGLNQYGRVFSLLHVVGLSLLVLIACIGTLGLLHHLALMNQRSEGPLTNVWSFITRTTMRFSGNRAYFGSIVFLGVSGFMIDGTMADWIIQNAPND